MQTLSLGDTLALYISRTDLAALGLTPTERDLATLARRALAERGASGDADITLEVYPGSAAAGDLLLFCSPLTRETVAFPTLAAAIEAARALISHPRANESPCGNSSLRSEILTRQNNAAPPHRGRGSLPCSDPAVLARRPTERAASESAPAASAASAPSPTPPAPSDGTAPAGAGTSTSATHAPSTLHLTDTNLWLLTLRATPRRAALLAALAAEFGERVHISPACLSEHAKLLIEQNALETLSEL